METTLRQLSVKTRLWAQVSACFAVILVITFLMLNSLYSELKQSKQLETQHIVETAHGIVSFYAEQVESSKMTLEQAQAEAKQVIEAMRYADGEYLFILDNQHTMLMHPIKPSLNGTNSASLKDPNGVHFIREMVSAATRFGEGSVQYMWPKTPNSTPIDKISYAKQFSPWGWVIATGIYIDDVQATFWQEVSTMVLLIVIIAIISIIITVNVLRSIIKPLDRIGSTIQRLEETGDLTLAVDTQGKDELTQIALGLNNMVSSFRDIAFNSNASVEQLNVSTHSLESVANDTKQAMANQQIEIEQAATAMNEMTATVSEVAHNVVNTANAAHKAHKEAGEGMALLNIAIEAISGLANEVEKAAAVIHKLGSVSEEIGNVTTVINGIAEQTNLLALNAAIEAARAGEQGRGFAVVADEVRALAQRTKESTESIQGMIEELQKYSHDAVVVMEEGQVYAERTVEQAQNADHALKEIVEDIAVINEMSTQIATASEEQSAIAEEINRGIITVSDHTSSTVEATQEIAQAGYELKALAVDLQKNVSKFKV